MISGWHDREELPFILNKLGLLGTGVEVGVQQGIFSEHIRKHWDGSTLVCVDPWRAYEGSLTTQERHDAFFESTGRKLDAIGKGYRRLRLPSTEAAALFAREGSFLDFVYLDADHAYESVRDDIAAWWPLIRPGGVLAGHDWVPDGWHRHDEPYTAYPTKELGGPTSFAFGVIRAVSEFAEATGQGIKITRPDDCGGWRSWLTIKAAA